MQERLDLLADTLDCIIAGTMLAILHQDREAQAQHLQGLRAVQKQLREMAKAAPR